MNRRTLLGRFAAVAVVAAVGPAVEAQASALSVEALAADVMANPGKYPDIEAAARRMTGETSNFGMARLETDAAERGYATWGDIFGDPAVESPDDAYARGWLQATMRAESREALGLPIAPQSDCVSRANHHHSVGYHTMTTGTATTASAAHEHTIGIHPLWHRDTENRLI